MRIFFAGLCTLIFSLFYHNTVAQCTTTINTFPYLENFESGNGSFTSGGISSSWQWGTIAKPVITGAASGSKGWTTGGLTGSRYNNGEDSWLMSPCFNLTNLTNPQISFKVFWETERRFDGAMIEYSTNSGANWQPLGSENSNANCQGENWFNFSPVKYLGDIAGWSGSVYPTTNGCQGGSGSGQWVTAKHRINFLAGNANVRFRFRFGAGTTCNDFDGFAIDDFSIRETPANASDFTFSCINSNTVQFTSVSAVCQTSALWDFGDPASGTNNSSSLESPSHIFSGPGIYNVKLTVSFSNNTPSITNKQIIITDAVTQVTTPIACFGQNGTASVVVTPPGSYTYLWSSSPAQNTALLSNVPAGTYTVTVSGNNVCTNNATVTLTAPPEFSVAVSHTDADCITGKGTVSTTVTGGTQPLQFLWNTGATAPSLTNLNPGNYSVQVTDLNGCTANGNATIQPPVNNLTIASNTAAAICTAHNGSISITLSGGTQPYTYLWTTGATTQNISGLAPGTYRVTVTDASQCATQSGDIIVPHDESILNLNPTVTPVRCNSSNGAISLNINGGNAPYQFIWNNGQTSQNITGLNPGNFSVSVTDINGCRAQLNNITVGADNYHIPVSLGIDRNFCPGIPITLTPGTGFASYLWQNGSTQPQLNVSDTGIHWVRVTDNNGCTGTDSVRIYSNCNDLFFPSAFTPNGDGLNDYFGALGDLTGVHDFELIIYGRWGQIVFRTKDPTQKWDGRYKGKLQQTQSFTFTAKYTIGTRMPQLVKGTFTLIQ